MAKVRWTTRASGFHVVRLVVKLADGTYGYVNVASFEVYGKPVKR